jgi:hypothetical protein
VSKLSTPEDAAVRHIVATLPPSATERRTILKMALAGLPADYPHRDWLQTLLEDCERFERDQLKFLSLLGHTGNGNTPAK